MQLLQDAICSNENAESATRWTHSRAIAGPHLPLAGNDLVGIAPDGCQGEDCIRLQVARSRTVRTRGLP